MPAQSNPIYASIPQLGGGYAIRFRDGSLLNGYGKLPAKYASLPCIRFDLSTDEQCSHWRKLATASWDDPVATMKAAVRAGCVMDNPTPAFAGV